MSFIISLVSFLLIFFPSVSLSECIEGNCKNGKGTFAYYDGSQYAGEWVDGKKHGQGTFSHADGKRYEGDWKEGMRDGLGKFIDEKGIVVKKGYWKNGMYKGEQ